MNLALRLIMSRTADDLPGPPIRLRNRRAGYERIGAIDAPLEVTVA
jgi:hypothetical protein